MSNVLKRTIVESLVAVALSVLFSIVPLYQTASSGVITFMPLLPLFILCLRWGGLESLPAIVVASLISGLFFTKDIYVLVLYYLIPYLNIAITDFYKSPKKPKLEILFLGLFQLYFLLFVTRLIASYYLYSSYYQQLGLKGMAFANGEYLLIECAITLVGVLLIYFVDEKVCRYQK